MKRIWFLWLGVVFVIGNAATIAAMIYKREFFIAALITPITIWLGKTVWEERRFLFDPKEYKT